MPEPVAQFLPAPVFLGFCLKKHTPPPPWPGFDWPAHIEEICSVSDCIATRPADWVDRWDFNRASCWDTEQAALDCLPQGERDDYRLYAYHAIPMLFGKEGEPAELSPDALYFPELPALPPEPDLSGYTFLGYDVVPYWTVETRVLGYDCSPLSCDGEALAHPVNRYCLFDRSDDASRAAARFGIEEPQPGPYIVFLVWRKREAGSPEDGTDREVGR